MKFWAIALALAIGIALLPSCQKKANTNTRVVVTAIGIDAAEEEECHLSIQAVEPLKTSGSLTEQEENATAVYEIDGPSVSGALKSFVTHTGRSAYILHNRVIAIGLDQIKRRSLSSLLDYFVRGSEGRSTVDMVICRDRASDLLKAPSEGYTIPAEHLSMFLEEGSRWGYAIPADLLTVERSTSGMFDAAIPIVRLASQEGEDGQEHNVGIVMDGTAIFRQGEYVGELDESGTRGLLFVLGKTQQCLINMAEEIGRQEDRLTIEISHARTDVDVKASGTAATFTFRVKCDAVILEEYLPGTLPLNQLPQVAKTLERRIQQDMETALSSTIGWGCDVAGFTRMIRKHCPEIIRGYEDQWPQRLQDCRFVVEVQADLTKAGGEADTATPRP